VDISNAFPDKINGGIFGFVDVHSANETASFIY